MTTTTLDELVLKNATIEQTTLLRVSKYAFHDEKNNVKINAFTYDTPQKNLRITLLQNGSLWKVEGKDFRLELPGAILRVVSASFPRHPNRDPCSYACIALTPDFNISNLEGAQTKIQIAYKTKSFQIQSIEGLGVDISVTHKYT
jgi:hypothetical protein